MSYKKKNKKTFHANSEAANIDYVQQKSDTWRAVCNITKAPNLLKTSQKTQKQGKSLYFIV